MGGGASESSDLGSVDETLAPGTRIGDFVIEAPLGSGAFGQVYAATHHLIGKAAAVKVLARRYSGDPQVVSRFMAEARAVNAIAHRNIVDIFDFGTLVDGRPFFIMEYLDGEPLDAALRRSGPPPFDDVRAIARGLGRALDAAHAKGIIHRDLKPANVFLLRDDDGTAVPKLLDFGVAKLVDAPQWSEHQTQTGAAIGTPAFMSPEQCLGQSIDHRTDVYALGVLFFQLLTGQLPFKADSTVELLMKHVSHAPPSPSSLRPELSAALDAVLARTMAKDRDQRPGSAGEAAEALIDALSGLSSTPSLQALAGGTSPWLASDGSSAREEEVGLEPTVASASTDGSTPSRSGARLRVGGGLLAAGLVAGGVALAWWSSVDSPRPRPSAIGPNGPTPAAAGLPGPEAPADAPPALVRVRVHGEPTGASILDESGELRGRVPASFEVPRSETTITLRIEADGYAPALHSFVPREDLDVAVALEAVPPPRAAPAESRRGSGNRSSPSPRPARSEPGKNDLEDPFQ